MHEVEKGVTFPSFAIEPDAIASAFPDWNLPFEMIESFQRHRARLELLAEEIDASFRNSGSQTITESEKDYFKNMFSALDAFVAITTVVSVLVAPCIVLIAANTASSRS